MGERGKNKIIHVMVQESANIPPTPPNSPPSPPEKGTLAGQMAPIGVDRLYRGRCALQGAAFKAGFWGGFKHNHRI